MNIKTTVAGVIAALLINNAAFAERYVRYEEHGTVSWGELVDGVVHQLSSAPYHGGKRTGHTLNETDAKLKAPVDPNQSFMTAFNYRDHKLPGYEQDPTKRPGLFTVPVSSIIGPEDDLVRPAEAKNFHYEAEMVIVVGKRAENVSLEDSSDYIFGITIGNDGSERDWQASDIQWLRAKGSKNFNAVGPHLVTGLDYTDLDIEGRHNGVKSQGANSSGMIFDFNYMVHYISKYFVLEPGDVIWSGTMGDTGSMKPGDTYAITVEGVGTLENKLVQEK
ncbi:fumarylacetoacetate hydrolase family protein [Emcibacteraceae bacterium]|jgi:2-keto-4-pentenoate hydratase/2-oxohepta-3-ene-1,7-dioic acid hydratase in catechol pathway|nr:fumarylacetoacetate hydrolase family protein [Emcibacteraceae bacterium]MDA9180496.1 fumarylacetoacetate hydrolase family protein [Emcibacteraceae bacterium]MDA9554488.1 fumarylacetoacetate hydrolase family protein [Emcibacteraceae bacterium]